MAASKTEYTGCSVLLYDEEGEYIHMCEVSDYDSFRYELRLRKGIPDTLKLDDKCFMLILTKPTPQEYWGRVVHEKIGYDRVFLLYRGKPRENRSDNRYRTNFPATIQALHRNNEIYPLFSPIPAQVINMGRSGLRLSAPVNTLRKGDRVSIIVHLEEREKPFIVLVTNFKDDEYQSEYGCRLVG